MPETESAELVVVDERSPVIAGWSTEEILGHAEQVARAVKGVVDQQGLARKIGQSEHIEVSGWQAMGHLLGAFGGQQLHADTLWTRALDRDDEVAWEAHVEIKTRGGDVVGSAEAMCSDKERNWRGRDEYAIRSMAETRAEGRAYRRAAGWLVTLVGYSPAATEEMPATEPAAAAPAQLPEWAQPVDDNDVQPAADLSTIVEALGVDGLAVFEVGKAILDRTGKLPACVALTFALLADVAQRPREAASAATPEPVAAEPVPDAEVAS